MGISGGFPEILCLAIKGGAEKYTVSKEAESIYLRKDTFQREAESWHIERKVSSSRALLCKELGSYLR